MAIRVVYTHTCNQCDWQPDPSARAGVETQIERHMAANPTHSVVTCGRPTEGSADDDQPSRSEDGGRETMHRP